MLRVVLAGWLDGGDEKAMRRLIRDKTGIGYRAAGTHVDRLKAGDTVILTMASADIGPFLHQAHDLGVETASMLVGKVNE